MDDKYVLDDAGDVIAEPDLMKWAAWFETADRRIGDDKIGGARISTVFLGLDHSFGHGPPLVFETMIFGGQHDGFQQRYSTRNEAVTGHSAALALMRASLQ